MLPAEPQSLKKIENDLIARFKPNSDNCGPRSQNVPGLGFIEVATIHGTFAGAMACLIKGFKNVSLSGKAHEGDSSLYALADVHNLGIINYRQGDTIMYTPAGEEDALLLYKLFKTGTNTTGYALGYLLGYSDADNLSFDLSSAESIKESRQWLAENTSTIREWAKSNIPDKEWVRKINIKYAEDEEIVALRRHLKQLKSEKEKNEQAERLESLIKKLEIQKNLRLAPRVFEQDEKAAATSQSSQQDFKAGHARVQEIAQLKEKLDQVRQDNIRVNEKVAKLTGEGAEKEELEFSQVMAQSLQDEQNSR